MAARQTVGQRGVAPEHAVRAARLGTGQFAVEEFACRQVERDLLAADRAQRQHGLRREAIVVLAGRAGADGPGRRIADAGRRMALQREAVGHPPLRIGAQRQARARHAEQLRRQVIVAAVQPRDAAHVAPAR
ncbi:conserved hypothetical protein, partial [Ricinus communis]